MKKLFLIVTVSLFHLVSMPVGAEVFKYQDKNGKWHFTDKPPKDKNASTVVSTAGTQAVKSDLKEDLHKAFNPDSNTGIASLSVVTVKTGSGSGSGFFVTADGYIITNRHVVRPATSSQWKNSEVKFDEWKQRLDDYKIDLKDDEERLTDAKRNIAENREYMESSRASDSEKLRYERYVKRYLKNKDRHQDRVSEYRRLKDEYRKEKSEFGFNSSMSNFPKSSPSF